MRSLLLVSAALARSASLRLLLVLTLGVSIGFASSQAAASGAAPASVPEALRPWIPWVMHDHEDQLCPDISGADDRACAWAGRLELALDARGGKFSQTWEVIAPGPILLPGGAAQWPLDVKVDGKAAVATAGDDEEEAPRVRVARRPPHGHGCVRLEADAGDAARAAVDGAAVAGAGRARGRVSQPVRGRRAVPAQGRATAPRPVKPTRWTSPSTAA